MNDETDEKVTKNRNMLYYNQLVKNDRKEETKRDEKAQLKKNKSFTSQSVQLRDFAPVPDGWEYFVYAFYAVVIPYVLGAIFLFVVVAGGKYENFMLLNMNAFPIVWLIGYEITSVIMLCWILVLYLQYEDEETYY